MFYRSTVAFVLALGSFGFAAEAEKAKEEEAPKVKPHFAGAKQQPLKEKKKTSKVKNKWVSSKTHPKAEKKQAIKEEAPVELVAEEELPYYNRFQERPDALTASNRSLYLAQRARESSQGTKPPTEGEIYPYHGVNAPRGHAYVNAAWLFWKTRQGGMEFALNQSSPFAAGITDGIPSKVSFDFDSGFRVGVGVHLPHDGWDIYTSYTDFRPEYSVSTSGFIFPTLLFQGAAAVTNVDAASAHWSITFQNLDVEIGRAFYIGRTLTLRPFIGMKGAWIDQDAKVHYAGGSIPAGQSWEVRNKNDFKGAGVRGGIESNWILGYGFSFLGNFSSAILYGQFKLAQDQTQTTPVVNLGSDFNLGAPTVQTLAGLSWDRNFYRDRCHVGVFAGFESQYWWSQNQMERFTAPGSAIYVRANDDLSFYGLTLQARIDF